VGKQVIEIVEFIAPAAIMAWLCWLNGRIGYRRGFIAGQLHEAGRLVNFLRSGLDGLTGDRTKPRQEPRDN
jgi:hypothetical protein